MVNSGLTPASDSEPPIDPEVALATAYAPRERRAALRALWAFDARLAAILRTTREPMLGQLRLTWWHDAVGKPGEIAGEPLLRRLALSGIPAERLQRIVTGWEALLDGDDAPALTRYGEARGGGLFAAAAGLSAGCTPIAQAGAGWALVDLARHHSQPAVAARALALAQDPLAAAPVRWPRSLRPLGILTKLARRDLGGLEPQGSPRRLLATGALALTGR